MSLDKTRAVLRSRSLRFVLGTVLILPPLAGLAILGVVLSGAAAGEVLASGAAMATALVVGALLILVPPALYIVSPDLYSEYQTLLEERAEEAMKHLSAEQDPPTPERSGSSAA